MSQPSDRILVINPNSTEAVTAGIDRRWSLYVCPAVLPSNA